MNSPIIMSSFSHIFDLNNTQNFEMSTINILFAEDHTMFRKSVIYALRDQTQFDTHIEEAADGIEAIYKATSNIYDVIILDLNLPKKNGFEVVKILKIKLNNPKILILTMHNESNIVKKVLNEGVLGYILKSAGIEELTQAIVSVNNNEYFYSNEISQILLNNRKNSFNSSLTNDVNTLSKRELEVVRWIAKGDSDKLISQKLNISHRTVGNHRQHILQKLGLRNSIELAVFAVHNNLD